MFVSSVIFTSLTALFHCLAHCEFLINIIWKNIEMNELKMSDIFIQEVIETVNLVAQPVLFFGFLIL
jgi:hypothetical protein